jgi:hypothetical protein
LGEFLFDPDIGASAGRFVGFIVDDGKGLLELRFEFLDVAALSALSGPIFETVIWKVISALGATFSGPVFRTAKSVISDCATPVAAKAHEIKMAAVVERIVQ